jgi:mannose/fructose-specific phosphotransferase system component IIA
MVRLSQMIRFTDFFGGSSSSLSSHRKANTDRVKIVPGVVAGAPS